MPEDKERLGIVTVGKNFKINCDPEEIGKITKAVKDLQKKIGINSYVICTRCGLGISGNPKTTHPEYIAKYCKGNCRTLGLDGKKE